jgi:uncharacterized protein (DUF4415 family)
MKRATTLKPPKSSSAKAADRDNPPWSEEMLGSPVLRRGRGPQKAPTKVLTTVRLDADVLAFFRAQGSGYQSRINDALKRVKERGLTTGSTAIARKRAAR